MKHVKCTKEAELRSICDLNVLSYAKLAETVPNDYFRTCIIG